MTSRSLPRRQRGLSLIELMVGIVVALLVALAAIGVSQFFMGRQRAAVDVGAAAGNGVNGLAAIKYEVAHAGLGFYADGVMLFPKMNLSQGSHVLASASALMPLRITSGPDGVTVDAVYGSALESVSPALLAAPTASTDTSMTLASYLPITPGQAVMLVPGAGSSSPCTLRTATAVTASTATTPLTLATDASGVANQAPFAPVSYTTADAVVQFGQLQWSRFYLEGGSLWMSRPLTDTRALMVHNVCFTAQYGVADASGSSVGSWQKAADDYATLDPAHLATVRALRVGIVVRSAQPEKKDATGHCTTSPSPPVLFDDTLVMTDPDWACYRYRISTTVVPMRNIILGSGA